MELSFVEKGFYADVVGPCSHNHEDSCGEYARRVAAGSLETVANLRVGNARLQEQVEGAEAMQEAAMTNMDFARAERDGWEALAKVRGEALEKFSSPVGDGYERIEPTHLRIWAHDIREREGYESILIAFLLRMADRFEEARDAIDLTPEEALAKEWQGE